MWSRTVAALNAQKQRIWLVLSLISPWSARQEVCVSHSSLFVCKEMRGGGRDANFFLFLLQYYTVVAERLSLIETFLLWTVIKRLMLAGWNAYRSDQKQILTPMVKRRLSNTSYILINQYFIDFSIIPIWYLVYVYEWKREGECKGSLGIMGKKGNEMRRRRRRGKSSGGYSISQKGKKRGRLLVPRSTVQITKKNLKCAGGRKTLSTFHVSSEMEKHTSWSS